VSAALYYGRGLQGAWEGLLCPKGQGRYPSCVLGVISLADGAGLLPHLRRVAGATLCEPRLPFFFCSEYGSDGQCNMGHLTNGGTILVRPYYS
jgi:hypothetical protein